jgi:hypothetical protein
MEDISFYGGGKGGSGFDPDSIIVQELGTNLNKVMSQDAVSKELAKKLEVDDLPDIPSIENIENEIEEIKGELDDKLNVADLPEIPADLDDRIFDGKAYDANYSTADGIYIVTDFEGTPALFKTYFINIMGGISSSNNAKFKFGTYSDLYLYRGGSEISYTYGNLNGTANGVYSVVVESPSKARLTGLVKGTYNQNFPGVNSVDQNTTSTIPLSSVVYAKAPKASPTFTGTISLNGNTTVGTAYTISYYRVPTVGGDLTNKLYVDTAINSAVSNVADQFGVVDKRLFNPYSWTPDEEIDFGDGLYGMRRTGSITASANTDASLMLLESGLIVSVVGGWWRKGGGNLRKYYPIYTVGVNAEFEYAVFSTGANDGTDKRMSWGTRSRAARTAGNNDSMYDIAFTYIKV